MNARPRMKLLKPADPLPAQPRPSIGMAATENADRAAYQSVRCQNGTLAPLPLTLAEALAEAYARDAMQDAQDYEPIEFADRRG